MNTARSRRRSLDCPCCDRTHRTWWTLAWCYYAPVLSVHGNPPADGPCFASVSDWDYPRHNRYRNSQRTVQLYATREEAVAFAAALPALGQCGAQLRLVLAVGLIRCLTRSDFCRVATAAMLRAEPQSTNAGVGLP
jgi:hypothetical protein